MFPLFSRALHTLHHHFLPPARTITLELNEFLRRVPHENRVQIEDKLATKAICEAGVVMATQLKGVNVYSSKVFRAQEAPFAALSALEKGRIKLEQFVTIQTQWALRNYLEKSGEMLVVNVPLFCKPGCVSEYARKILRKTWLIPKHKMFRGSFNYSPINSHVTPEEEDLIFEYMQSAPLSEKRFSIFVDPESSAFLEGHMKTVSQAIYSTGFNVFSRITPDSEEFPDMYYSPVERILPSHSLVLAYFKARFGEEAILPYPVLGSSETEDLIQSQTVQKRDAMIPFPGLMVTAAHGHTAPGFDFYYHDLYHAFVTSCVGPKYAKAYLKLADLFLQLSHASSFLKPFLDVLVHRCVDMEHSLFRPEIRVKEYFWNGDETKEMIFWTALGEAIRFTVTSGKVKKECYEEAVSTNFFATLVDDIFVQNRKEWQALGVTEQGLFQAACRLERIVSHSKFENMGLEISREVEYYEKGLHPIKIMEALVKSLRPLEF